MTHRVVRLPSQQSQSHVVTSFRNISSFNLHRRCIAPAPRREGTTRAQSHSLPPSSPSRRAEQRTSFLFITSHLPSLVLTLSHSLRYQLMYITNLSLPMDKKSNIEVICPFRKCRAPSPPLPPPPLLFLSLSSPLFPVHRYRGGRLSIAAATHQDTQIDSTLRSEREMSLGRRREQLGYYFMRACQEVFATC